MRYCHRFTCIRALGGVGAVFAKSLGGAKAPHMLQMRWCWWITCVRYYNEFTFI